MRVVVAEDYALLRAGLVELLAAAGFDVVGQAGTADETLETVAALRPDVVVLDIRMPPTNTLEGLRVAGTIRETYGSDIGILLLSQHVETQHAIDLLATGAAGIGYLLKDRILDPADLAEAVRRVGNGGSAIDPMVIERLVRRTVADTPLAALTEREREVLGCMAEGRSNQSIGAALHISGKTVEACIGRIFTKLGLEPGPGEHRRVLAVVTFLRER